MNAEWTNNNGIHFGSFCSSQGKTCPFCSYHRRRPYWCPPKARLKMQETLVSPYGMYPSTILHLGRTLPNDRTGPWYTQIWNILMIFILRLLQVLGIYTFVILFLRWNPRDWALYSTVFGVWVLIGFLVLIGPAAAQRADKGPYCMWFSSPPVYNY